MFGDNDLVIYIEEAIEMIENQIIDADVYGLKTHKTLDKASGLAAFFKFKAAEMKIKGRKDAAIYLTALSHGMDDIVASLKYKINANK